jgi:hypothetical protein
VINKYIKHIYWLAAAAMVLFKDDEMISHDAEHIGVIIVMVAGCFVFGGRND